MQGTDNIAFKKHNLQSGKFILFWE